MNRKNFEMYATPDIAPTPTVEDSGQDQVLSDKEKELLGKFVMDMSSDEKRMLQDALVLLRKLDKEKRKHSTHVAKRAARIIKNPKVLVGALLHDLMERKPNVFNKYADQIPAEVKDIIEILSVNIDDEEIMDEEGFNVPLEHLKEVFPSLEQEKRNQIIIIKLCDRLDNLKKRIKEGKVSKNYRKKTKELFRYLAAQYIHDDLYDRNEVMALGLEIAELADCKNYFSATPKEKAA